MHTGFWWEGRRERHHLEDLGVDGRLKLKRIIKNWYGGMDWIDLVRDRDRWQALVNALMNTRIALNVGNFSTT
jgi:hypothetical protein